MNIYLLREKHGTKLAFFGDVLAQHFTDGPKKGTFSVSFGENASDDDIFHAVSAMEEEAKACGEELALSKVTESTRDRLEALYPDKWRFCEDRDYEEYIHKAERLAKMRGKKFSSKRNHISRFLKEYPDTRVVPISTENAEDAETVAKAWLDFHESAGGGDLKKEFSAIKKALSEWEELELSGILIYIGDAPVGMSVASMISSGVWDIHFEKALPEYPHIWALIVKSMAEYLKDAEYINREEDIGSEGLRKSKLSYRPDILNRKYCAYLKGDLK